MDSPVNPRFGEFDNPVPRDLPRAFSLLDFDFSILDSDPDPEVTPVFETPYDILMIVWGLVFIVAWVAFIAAMNHIFQNEEREWEMRDRATETSATVE